MDFRCTLSTLRLKHLGEDFIPVEGREEAAGGQHEGSLRQESPSVVHPVQISSSHVSHADCSGWAVQELVAIPAESDSHWWVQSLTALLFDTLYAGRIVTKDNRSCVLLVHWVVKLSDSLMSPVLPELRQNLTEHIWSVGRNRDWIEAFIRLLISNTVNETGQSNHSIMKMWIFRRPRTWWWCHRCQRLWPCRPSSTGRWCPRSDRCPGTEWLCWRWHH